MVERGRRTVVATFFAPGPLGVGSVVALGEGPAHHMHVRRLASGVRIGLVNGAGTGGGGTLTRLGRFDAEVALDEIWQTPRPVPVHLIVPIADRDRMLWLAEKATELSVTSWRPAMWARSHSVSPKGEGRRFEEKVRARMVAALEQSEGVWFPDVFPEATIDGAAQDVTAGTRLLLDPDGLPLLTLLGEAKATPVTIVVGPEGGAEADERARLITLGYRPASLGDSILRFETAAVAALSTVRAALQPYSQENQYE